jgi:hypothetical protein
MRSIGFAVKAEEQIRSKKVMAQKRHGFSKMEAKEMGAAAGSGTNGGSRGMNSNLHVTNDERCSIRRQFLREGSAWSESKKSAGNARLAGRTKGGGFSTAIAALIPPHGPVTIANAGHLAPYLDGKEVKLPNALPLGMVSGTKYESTQIQLLPGSRLTFYSDGVVEAQNESGELFGFERGQQISTRGATAIVEAARKFGQSDDITVVMIERLAAGAETVAERVEPSLAPA